MLGLLSSNNGAYKIKAANTLLEDRPSVMVIQLWRTAEKKRMPVEGHKYNRQE